jgi:hypothetical protein
MIHFAYPNVKMMFFEFIGCGRFIASEHQPNAYKLPSKIINRQQADTAANILAYESFETKKIIYERKDCSDEKYAGESLHLAYLFALISRSRDVRLKTDCDIWCTGSIEVIDGNPFLTPVIPGGFDTKLRKGFLSEKNQDTLFIVPEANFLPEHHELCHQHNINVFSVEQFGEQCTEYDFKRKTILKVRSDELFALISLVFTMGQNPYKGLEYFEEEDADCFFGREDVIRELWDIYQNLPASPMRLMAILGHSGSGKSSIVRAGLIPKIRQMYNSQIILIRPGSEPFQTLKRALTDMPSSPVIIVDQFEEIYSLCEDKQEAQKFVNKLMALASYTSDPATVIIILRTDFLKHTERHPEFNHAITLKQKQIIVPAMQRNNIRTVITEPARRAGYLFNDSVVDELISQTERHQGALPLLEFALSRIWQGVEKSVRPEETLKDINGVGGALANKAQELYDSLGEYKQKIIRRAFLRLINIGEGMFDTRRRVLLSELVAKGEDIIYVRKFVGIFSASGARFITLSSDSDGKETVEITHEALFEHWDLLKKWIEIYREDILFYRSLFDAVHKWNNKGRPSGYLWRSHILDELKDFYQRWFSDMTELETEFYQASVDREKKDSRIRQTVISLLLMLTLVVVGLAYNAKSLKEENETLKVKINEAKPTPIPEKTSTPPQENQPRPQSSTTVPDKKETVVLKNNTNYGCDIIKDGLVAWYPFDEDSQDKSGNQNHGVAKGNLTYASGKFGQAAKFDGVSSYITVPNHDSLNLQNMTLSAWVYDYSHPAYGPLGTSLILNKGVWSFSGDQKRQYQFSSSYGFNIEFAQFGLFNVNNLEPWEMLYSKDTIPVNQWKYIAVTYDGYTQKIYVDGNLNNSRDTVLNVFTPTNPTPLTIGAGFRDDNDKPLNIKNGLIDDLRVYNRALSDSEIRQLYECANAKNSSHIQSPIPDVKITTLTDKEATKVATKNSISCGCDIIKDDLVACYPFNGNANDESGNGNNGTVNGATLTTDRFGNPNSAYLFNGANSFIEVKDNQALRLANTNFTLSTWVYETERNQSYQDAILVKRGENDPDGYFFSIIGATNPPYTPGSILYQVSGGYNPCIVSVKQILLNSWHHVVLIYDNTQKSAKMYINGSLEKSVLYKNAVPNPSGNLPSPNPNTISNLFIGKDSGKEGYFFHGIIDDIRIYNRALSESEIRQLHECANTNNSSTKRIKTSHPDATMSDKASINSVEEKNIADIRKKSG